MALVELSTALLFTGSVVFCRMGSSFLFLPGVGEFYIPSNIRLIMALGVTLLLLTSTFDNYIPLPDSPIEILLLLISEITIGIGIALVSRIFLSALHSAGLAIGSQIGFASALVFDPGHAAQGNAIGNFLTICALMLIFSLNLHITLIQGLANSYETLPIGSFFDNYQSFTELIIKTVISAWNTGMRLAAPFIVIGITVYFGSGILSRLMPQLQIFFLVLPAQILLGILIITLVFSASMAWFISEYEANIGNLLGF